MRRILITLLTLTLVASACSGDDPIEESGDTPTTSTTVQRNDDGDVVVEIDGDELVLTSGLSGFDDCDALLDHLRTEGAERSPSGSATAASASSALSAAWRSTPPTSTG